MVFVGADDLDYFQVAGIPSSVASEPLYVCYIVVLCSRAFVSDISHPRMSIEIAESGNGSYESISDFCCCVENHMRESNYYLLTHSVEGIR